MKQIRIALFSGGDSSEREVSIKTGNKIAQALSPEKYRVSRFDPKDQMEEFIAAAKRGEFDLAFPALHGPGGEDGTIQKIFDSLGLPYAFSGVDVSALTMNKDLTKKALAKEDVLLPRHIIAGDLGELNSQKLFVPAVVKPIDQGSSVATFIVKEENELAEAVKKVLATGSKAMIEEFIEGREVTAGILGNGNPRPLPIVEIRPKQSHFFDYNAKYVPGASEEICPADLSDDLTLEIQEKAVRIHQVLGCRGVTRSDFIIKDGKPYFLEINTIPGMTETSLVPLAASKAGISFSELLDELIKLAPEK